jgi:hypothetical protein
VIKYKFRAKLHWKVSVYTNLYRHVSSVKRRAMGCNFFKLFTATIVSGQLGFGNIWQTLNWTSFCNTFPGQIHPLKWNSIAVLHQRVFCRWALLISIYLNKFTWECLSSKYSFCRINVKWAAHAPISWKGWEKSRARDGHSFPRAELKIINNFGNLNMKKYPNFRKWSREWWTISIFYRLARLFMPNFDT